MAYISLEVIKAVMTSLRIATCGYGNVCQFVSGAMSREFLRPELCNPEENDEYECCIWQVSEFRR